MSYVKTCPTKNSLRYIGKKCTLEIVRDLFFGKNKFSEFLQENPGITKKILTQRLKELEYNNFIEKKIISESPYHFEYQLTEKGYALNKIFYDLAFLSIDYYKEDIYVDPLDPSNEERMILASKGILKLMIKKKSSSSANRRQKGYFITIFDMKI